MSPKDHPTIIISAERSRTFARRLREALRERHGVDLKLNEAQALTAIAAEVRGGWHAVARMEEPAPEDRVNDRTAALQDLPGEPVMASMHDDNHATGDLRIDIRRWLSGASEDEIVELAGDDWAYAESADRIYYFYEALGSSDPDEDVTDLTDALRLGNRGGRVLGFGVSVDAGDAVAWLARNRPDLDRALYDEDYLPGRDGPG